MVIASDFDAGSHLLRRRSSLGFDAEFSLDGNGRPVRIALFESSSFSFTYDVAGSEVSRFLPGNLRLAQDRDERGRVIRQFVSSSGVPTTGGPDIEGFLHAGIRRSFQYDGNNAPTTIDDRRIGAATYTYDPAEQLLSADYESQNWEKFEYGLTGSISRITSPHIDARLIYGSGNRLRQADSSEYDYDLTGRRIRKTDKRSSNSHWKYSWDSLGRLRSVTVPSGEVWTYAYDALGRRITKAGPRGTTRFVWCGNTMLHGIGATGVVESWLYDDASLVPIAKAENGKIYSIIPDPSAFRAS